MAIPSINVFRIGKPVPWDGNFLPDLSIDSSYSATVVFGFITAYMVTDYYVTFQRIVLRM